MESKHKKRGMQLNVKLLVLLTLTMVILSPCTMAAWWNPLTWFDEIDADSTPLTGLTIDDVAAALQDWDSVTASQVIKKDSEEMVAFECTTPPCTELRFTSSPLSKIGVSFDQSVSTLADAIDVTITPSGELVPPEGKAILNAFDVNASLKQSNTPVNAQADDYIYSTNFIFAISKAMVDGLGIDSSAIQLMKFDQIAGWSQIPTVKLNFEYNEKYWYRASGTGFSLYAIIMTMDEVTGATTTESSTPLTDTTTLSEMECGARRVICKEGSVCRFDTVTAKDEGCFPPANVGQYCRVTENCIEGLYCDQTNNECVTYIPETYIPEVPADSVTEEVPAELGSRELCNRDNDLCGEGLVCRYLAESSTATYCWPPSTEGKHCRERDTDCAEGLACVNNACFKPAESIAVAKTEGQVCTQQSECQAGLYCMKLYTQATQQVCIRACLQDTDCQTNRCIIAEGQTKGKCMPPKQTSTEVTETTQEDTAQETTQEDTAQETTQEVTAQETTQEVTAQETTQEDTAQETTQEDTAQETTQEDTAQETTQEVTAQETTQEGTAQETTQESTNETVAADTTAQERKILAWQDREVTPGTPATYDLRKRTDYLEEYPVRQISTTFNDQVVLKETTVEEIPVPADKPLPPTKRAYKVLEINTRLEKDGAEYTTDTMTPDEESLLFRQVIIEFTVPVSQLVAEGKQPEDVKLTKYDDAAGKWIELPTVYNAGDSTEQYYVFRAVSRTQSTFAIVADVPEGAGATAAIIAQRRAQRWQSIAAGGKAELTVNDPAHAFARVTNKFRRGVSNVEIAVETAAISPEIPSDKARYGIVTEITCAYNETEAGTEPALEEASFIMSIPKTWFEENSVDPMTFTIGKYINGERVELPTIRREENTTYLFATKTTSCSPYDGLGTKITDPLLGEQMTQTQTTGPKITEETGGLLIDSQTGLQTQDATQSVFVDPTTGTQIDLTLEDVMNNVIADPEDDMPFEFGSNDIEDFLNNWLGGTSQIGDAEPEVSAGTETPEDSVEETPEEDTGSTGGWPTGGDRQLAGSEEEQDIGYIPPTEPGDMETLVEPEQTPEDSVEETPEEDTGSTGGWPTGGDRQLAGSEEEQDIGYIPPTEPGDMETLVDVDLPLEITIVSQRITMGDGTDLYQKLVAQVSVDEVELPTEIHITAASINEGYASDVIIDGLTLGQLVNGENVFDIPAGMIHSSTPYTIEIVAGKDDSQPQGSGYTYDDIHIDSVKFKGVSGTATVTQETIPGDGIEGEECKSDAHCVVGCDFTTNTCMGTSTSTGTTGGRISAIGAPDVDTTSGADLADIYGIDRQAEGTEELEENLAMRETIDEGELEYVGPGEEPGTAESLITPIQLEDDLEAIGQEPLVSDREMIDEPDFADIGLLPGVGNGEICNNTLDEDGDKLADCYDLDCDGTTECGLVPGVSQACCLYDTTEGKSFEYKSVFNTGDCSGSTDVIVTYNEENCFAYGLLNKYTPLYPPTFTIDRAGVIELQTEELKLGDNSEALATGYEWHFVPTELTKDSVTVVLQVRGIVAKEDTLDYSQYVDKLQLNDVAFNINKEFTIEEPEVTEKWITREYTPDKIVVNEDNFIRITSGPNGDLSNYDDFVVMNLGIDGAVGMLSTAGPVVAPETETEFCSDYIDNDYDRLADCFDEDCTDAQECQAVPGSKVCCLFPDYRYQYFESFNNECEMTYAYPVKSALECVRAGNALKYTPITSGAVETECTDSLDNDEDKYVDCFDDSNCLGTQECGLVPEESQACCFYHDVEGDRFEYEQVYSGCEGAFDAIRVYSAPDCYAYGIAKGYTARPAGMMLETDCTDGRDDNRNGEADCFDLNCMDEPECVLNVGDSACCLQEELGKWRYLPQYQEGQCEGGEVTKTKNYIQCRIAGVRAELTEWEAKWVKPCTTNDDCLRFTTCVNTMCRLSEGIFPKVPNQNIGPFIFDRIETAADIQGEEQFSLQTIAYYHHKADPTNIMKANVIFDSNFENSLGTFEDLKAGHPVEWSEHRPKRKAARIYNPETPTGMAVGDTVGFNEENLYSFWLSNDFMVVIEAEQEDPYQGMMFVSIFQSIYEDTSPLTIEDARIYVTGPDRFQTWEVAEGEIELTGLIQDQLAKCQANEHEMCDIEIGFDSDVNDDQQLMLELSNLNIEYGLTMPDFSAQANDYCAGVYPCNIDVVVHSDEVGALTVIDKEIEYGSLCQDTDGGLDYFEAGDISTGSESDFDTCVNVHTLKEAYCDDAGQISYVMMPCDTSCSEGKCVAPAEDILCEDTDTGIAPFYAGTATGVMSVELAELLDSQSMSVEPEREVFNDECELTADGAKLKEYYCGYHPNYTRAVYGRIVTCENGCENGACTEPQSYPTRLIEEDIANFSYISSSDMLVDADYEMDGNAWIGAYVATYEGHNVTVYEFSTESGIDQFIQDHYGDRGLHTGSIGDQVVYGSSVGDIVTFVWPSSNYVVVVENFEYDLADEQRYDHAGTIAANYLDKYPSSLQAELFEDEQFAEMFIDDLYGIIDGNTITPFPTELPEFKIKDYLFVGDSEYPMDEEEIDDVLIRKKTDKGGDEVRIIYGFKNLESSEQQVSVEWKTDAMWAITKLKIGSFEYTFPSADMFMLDVAEDGSILLNGLESYDAGSASDAARIYLMQDNREILYLDMEEMINDYGGYYFDYMPGSEGLISISAFSNVVLATGDDPQAKYDIDLGVKFLNAPEGNSNDNDGPFNSNDDGWSSGGGGGGGGGSDLNDCDFWNIPEDECCAFLEETGESCENITTEEDTVVDGIYDEFKSVPGPSVPREEPQPYVPPAFVPPEEPETYEPEEPAYYDAYEEEVDEGFPFIWIIYIMIAVLVLVGAGVVLYEIQRKPAGAKVAIKKSPLVNDILLQFIDKQLKKGISEAMVRKALAKAHWKKEIVDATFNYYYMTREASAAKASGVEMKIVKYILKERSAGFTDDKIKLSLISAKWTKDKVDASFAYVNKLCFAKPISVVGASGASGASGIAGAGKPTGGPIKMPPKSKDVNDKVIKFIVGKRKAGLKDDMIRQALLRAKWDKKVVAATFDYMAKVDAAKKAAAAGSDVKTSAKKTATKLAAGKTSQNKTTGLNKTTGHKDVDAKIAGAKAAAAKKGTKLTTKDILGKPAKLPEHVDAKLVDFINTQRHRGLSYDTIRAGLLKAGWKIAIVNATIAYVRSRDKPTETAAKPTKKEIIQKKK